MVWKRNRTGAVILATPARHFERASLTHGCRGQTFSRTTKNVSLFLCTRYPSDLLGGVVTSSAIAQSLRFFHLLSYSVLAFLLSMGGGALTRAVSVSDVFLVLTVQFYSIFFSVSPFFFSISPPRIDIFETVVAGGRGPETWIPVDGRFDCGYCLRGLHWLAGWLSGTDRIVTFIF